MNGYQGKKTSSHLIIFNHIEQYNSFQARYPRGIIMKYSSVFIIALSSLIAEAEMFFVSRESTGLL